MYGFEENVRKPGFWAKMAKFRTKKGSKNGPDFFFQNKNFHWLFTINLAYIKKLTKNHQRFRRKWPKNRPKHIMPPQAMYFWPKYGQNGQNKNFSRRNTVIRWFKAIVPSFWPSFRQIWCTVSKKMSENLVFEQKWPNFGPKKGPKRPRFFFQNKNFH